MTQYFSDKLRVMSFLLIILVLYIHSGFHEIPSEIEGMTFNIELQRAVSGMLGRLAVPLFFMISGYLFFLNTDSGLSAVFGKMKKRVRTLVIPYVIGCLFVPLFWIGMEQVPFAAQFCNGQNVAEQLIAMPLDKLAKSLFFATDSSSTPMAFQLWFLRDLITVVALSPLLHIVRKSLLGGYLTLAALFVLTFADVPVVPVGALFWFLLGSMMLDRMSGCRSVAVPLAYIAFAVAEMFFPDIEVWTVLRIPVVIVGVWALWTVYDWFVPHAFVLKKHRLLRTLCAFTFFIYLFHEPTLNIVRKLVVVPFGAGEVGFAVSYLLSPWVFAGVWVAVGMQMHRCLPRVYAVCTGGR